MKGSSNTPFPSIEEIIVTDYIPKADKVIERINGFIRGHQGELEALIKDKEQEIAQAKEWLKQVYDCKSHALSFTNPKPIHQELSPEELEHLHDIPWIDEMSEDEGDMVDLTMDEELVAFHSHLDESRSSFDARCCLDRDISDDEWIDISINARPVLQDKGRSVQERTIRETEWSPSNSDDVRYDDWLYDNTESQK